MKGELNVMAPYSRVILSAPSLHGLKKEEDLETRGEQIQRERERGKDIETKHINTGIGGLTAHILGLFFLFLPREKNNSSHECVPNESTTTSLNK